MILIIKTGNGGPYLDIIHSVYQINRKNLTVSQIENDYNAYLVSKIEKIGLAVNSYSPSEIFHKSLQPDGKTPSRELIKKHKQILKENTFIKFIEKTYKHKKLENIQEYQLNPLKLVY
jgi:hypothetical protein